MKLGVQVNGSLDALMRGEGRNWEIAVTRSVGSVAGSIKNAWRGQVRAAGLGNRLAGSIRSEVYPKGTVSASAAGFVYTNADDILTSHDEGSLITARSGLWLAIPTEAAMKSRRHGRISPVEWERRSGQKLRMVFRPGRPALLVAEGRQSMKTGQFRSRSRLRLKSGAYASNVATVPIFILVPQVQMPKRLDLQAAAEREAGRLDQLIVTNYERLR